MENKSTLKALIAAQRNEISEYHTYSWLSARIKDEKNREIIKSIGNDERKHYEVIKGITGTEVKPRKVLVLFYRLVSIVLGLSFGLRLMEKGEKAAERIYSHLKDSVPELAEVFRDEEEHEKELLAMINEEMIEYAGSMVLGLNDALMELTGVLAFSIFIILSYTFYITTAKGLPLWQRFGEMALISAGVAGISFLVGVVIRTVFKVEV
jgi:rubrerythrin